VFSGFIQQLAVGLRREGIFLLTWSAKSRREKDGADS